MENQPPASVRTWQDITAHLMERYAQMLLANHLLVSARLGPDLATRTRELCEHAIEHLHQLPEDKTNRWVGFVQGVLVCAGIITIEGERDYTRPLFHAVKGPFPTMDARSRD